MNPGASHARWADRQATTITGATLGVAFALAVALGTLACGAAAPVASGPVVTVTPSEVEYSGQSVVVAWAGATNATYWDTLGVFVNASAPASVGFFVSRAS